LNGFERLEAAGAYIVDTEEELMDTLLSPVWRRVSSVMLLNRQGATEYVSVDPDELNEALLRDCAQHEPVPSTTNALQKDRRSRARDILAQIARSKKP
jgi:hypothetical protein